MNWMMTLAYMMKKILYLDDNFAPDGIDTSSDDIYIMSITPTLRQLHMYNYSFQKISWETKFQQF